MLKDISKFLLTAVLAYFIVTVLVYVAKAVTGSTINPVTVIPGASVAIAAARREA